MSREIFEQPDALRRTLSTFTIVHGSTLSLRDDLFAPALPALVDRQKLVIAASGSSRHAGLVAKAVLEDAACLPVEVEYASEYICRTHRTTGESGFLVLSQSGETVDTLQALRDAHTLGLPTIAIVNQQQSSMGRLADCSLITQAGMERAVPATKSFTTQLLLLNLLALVAGRARGLLDEAQVVERLNQMAELPALLERMLPTWELQLQAMIHSLGFVTEYVFLGRGVHLAIAYEAALKLKESAYVHAEAYPAGELKHGPNAVLSQTSAVVVLATQDSSSQESVRHYNKTVSLIRDLNLQGTRLIAVASEGDSSLRALCEEVIVIPRCVEALTPILEIVPLQLFAYWTAMRFGIDIDHPRNLNKAVLVE